MLNRKDFNYINRRNQLIAFNSYCMKMIQALNKDTFFNDAGISFSHNNNNFHFVERFLDRDLEINETLPKFYNFILQHRCEIIYFCYMNTDSSRLELIIDNTLLGLTKNDNKILSFRTIFEQYENRLEGREKSFIINKDRRYYE